MACNCVTVGQSLNLSVLTKSSITGLICAPAPGIITPDRVKLKCQPLRRDHGKALCRASQLPAPTTRVELGLGEGQAKASGVAPDPVLGILVVSQQTQHVRNRNE